MVWSVIHSQVMYMMVDVVVVVIVVDVGVVVAMVGQSQQFDCFLWHQQWTSFNLFCC